MGLLLTPSLAPGTETWDTARPELHLRNRSLPWRRLFWVNDLHLLPNLAQTQLCDRPLGLLSDPSLSKEWA